MIKSASALADAASNQNNLLAAPLNPADNASAAAAVSSGQWRAQTLAGRETAARKAGRMTEVGSTADSTASGAQTSLSGEKTIGLVGTTVALQANQMSRGEQQNEIAGLAKQFLPARKNSGRTAGDGVAEIQGDAPLNAAALEMKGQGTVTSAADGELEKKANASDSQPLMNRLASDILHETVILRQFKPDKLAVILRPDASTQISLQLRCVDQSIVASARCDRGDFGYLSAHWSELQRAMDQQGVRLSPIEDSGAAASFAGGGAFGNSAQTPYEKRARRLEERVLPTAGIRRAQNGEGAAAVGNNGSIQENSLLQTWA